MPGTMNYQVTDAQGQDHELDEDYLRQHLQDQGYQVAGTSADGMSMTFQDQKGQYNAKVPEVLKKMGYTVNGMKPASPDVENIQPEWRAAISKLPDDDMKKAYLQAKMNRTMPGAQVIGQGHDWHVFNPSTSQWVALTNDPSSLGKADLAEIALEAPRGLSAIAGGALGATLGSALPGGELVGGALGTFAGGASLDALQRLGFNAKDPEYAQATLGKMDQQGWDIATNSGLDLLGVGAGKALGPLAKAGLGRLGTKGVAGAAEAPVSKLATGVGKVLNKVGAGAEETANFLKNSDLGRFVSDYFGPLGDLSGAGSVAEAPQAAVETGGKTFQNFVHGLGDEASPKLQGVAEQLGKDRGLTQGPSLPQRIGNWFAGKSEEQGPQQLKKPAANFLGNVGEMLGKKSALNASTEGEQEAIKAATDQWHQAAAPYMEDMSPETKDLALEELSQGIKGAQRAGAEEAANAKGAKWGRAGEKVGSLIDTTAEAGRAVGQAADTATQTGLGAIGLGAKGVRGVGAALQGAGEMGQGIENPAYGLEGVHHLYDKYLRQRMHRNIMKQNQPPVLASQNI